VPVTLRPPVTMVWDDRIHETDKARLDEISASLVRLDGMRAVEINVEGAFLRSKIAWKLVTYQHALLHRIIALMDGVAVAWNARSTLAAILAARAFMETFAVMDALEKRVVDLLGREDLGGLDDLAGNGIFANRDEPWLAEFPETKAVNAVTFIDRFNKRVEGFRAHYDRLSERCHPNSAGHNFMFSKLDTKTGSVTYFEEREPANNGDLIIGAILLLPLVESMMPRLDALILKVSDLQHRVSPVGVIEETEP
jgi:hypothetical protein